VAVALHVAADHGSVEDSLRRVAIFHEGLKPIHVGCTDREGHPVRIALTRTSRIRRESPIGFECQI
jgi:hypothetical protein